VVDAWQDGIQSIIEEFEAENKEYYAKKNAEKEARKRASEQAARDMMREAASLERAAKEGTCPCPRVWPCLCFALCALAELSRCRMKGASPSSSTRGVSVSPMKVCISLPPRCPVLMRRRRFGPTPRGGGSLYGPDVVLISTTSVAGK